LVLKNKIKNMDSGDTVGDLRADLESSPSKKVELAIVREQGWSVLPMPFDQMTREQFIEQITSYSGQQVADMKKSPLTGDR